MSRPKSHKRDREKARRERVAAKAARREERRSSTDETPEPLSPADQAAALAELAELHRRFADEEIGFDEFEDAKAELMGRLDVD